MIRRKLILLPVLLASILGSADAQPPPPPVSGLWVDDGGAAGETATLAISMNIAPYVAYAIAFSHGICSKPCTPQLLNPIHLLVSGQFTTRNVATHKVFIPDVKALVGLPVYLQGAVSDGNSWIFTHVCTWAIAPNLQRRFTLASSLRNFPQIPGNSHARVTLADGTVLLTGGRDLSLPGWRYTSAAYLYDPAKASARSTGSLTGGRGGHVLRLLQDSTVLAVGGDQTTTAPTAELYDPRSGLFQTLGGVPWFLIDPTATVVKAPGSGREYVLLAGGSTARTDTPTARAMLYDVQNRTFTALPDMARPRLHAAAVPLAGGAVLITGGMGPNQAVHDDAELFLLSTRKFYPWGRMTRPRYGHAMVALDPVHALIMSGGDSLGARTCMELFAGLQLRSCPLPHRLHFGRIKFNPVMLSDGSLLVAGGFFDAPAQPGRTPEVVSASGVTLLRPIGEQQPTMEIQALHGGMALAIGYSTTHHLK